MAVNRYILLVLIDTPREITSIVYLAKTDTEQRAREVTVRAVLSEYGEEASFNVRCVLLDEVEELSWV
jgi:hypothetical protein